MKERILTGWTFQRGLYLILGGIIIAQSILNKQWFGVVLGGYFAAMGLFALGCAAGNCFGSNCNYEPEQKSKTKIEDVDFPG